MPVEGNVAPSVVVLDPALKQVELGPSQLPLLHEQLNRLLAMLAFAQTKLLAREAVHNGGPTRRTRTSLLQEVFEFLKNYSTSSTAEFITLLTRKWGRDAKGVAMTRLVVCTEFVITAGSFIFSIFCNNLLVVGLPARVPIFQGSELTAVERQTLHEVSFFAGLELSFWHRS